MIAYATLPASTTAAASPAMVNAAFVGRNCQLLTVFVFRHARDGTRRHPPGVYAATCGKESGVSLCRAWAAADRNCFLAAARPRATRGRDVPLRGVTPPTCHLGAGKLKSAPSLGFWSCV